MLGDFNDIVLSIEVSRGYFFPSRAFPLSNVFVECGMLDMGVIKGLFM